jgi:hypothetical protein
MGTPIRGHHASEDATRPPLTLADLNGFTGCDQWTRHWMDRNLLYSEGMAHVAEHAGGGAFWLLDAIASHEVGPTITALRQADPDFDFLHFWYLHVDTEKHAAVLECKVDSDQPAVVTQEIPLTDFPLSELTVFVGNDGPGTPTKLFLPSEY